MIRRLLLGSVFLIPFSLMANERFLSHELKNRDEEFLVRRIYEFWKDGDYTLVRTQIIDFIDNYPESQLCDSLKGILGDIYLEEKNFKEAINTYNQIDSSEIKEKTLLNKLQCYYEFSLYEDIISAGTPYLNSGKNFDNRKEEFAFLMAEAYFRSSLSLELPEVKQERIVRAKTLYESLKNSAFKETSKFALAEIYKQTSNYQQASALFIELANKHSEKQEELLFHAALCFSEFDKSEAIETFTTIISLEGKKKEDALLNRLILYFQLDQFRDVLDSAPHFSTASQKDRPFISYIFARSAYGEKDYNATLTYIDQIEDVASLEAAQQRNLTLIEMGACQNLKDEARYKKTLNLFETEYPLDSELGKAIFIHAMLLKESMQSAEALIRLEYVLQHYPNFECHDALILEYGLITYEMGLYETARKQLKTYLTDYAEMGQEEVAWKYFLSSSLNLLDLVNKDPAQRYSYTKEQFVQDMEFILNTSQFLSIEEKRECRFAKAKMQYELQDYKAALFELSTYFTDYEKSDTLADAHLLSALCYNKLEQSSDRFTFHAEEAIKTSTSKQDLSSIHIELYNAYLSVVERVQQQPIDSANERLIKEKYQAAAEHLFSAFSRKDIEIKKENLLWLASFYYNQLSPAPPLYSASSPYLRVEEVQSAKKSQELLQNILINENNQLNKISSHSTFSEWEVLRLSDLYSRLNQNSEKIALLSDLVQQQRQDGTVAWKFRQETLVELAKAQEKGHQKEAALQSLKAAYALSNGTTFMSEYILIHKERLEFELIAEKNEKPSIELLTATMNHLKELQIRKQLSSEPLHLEASLIYAKIRASLCKESEKEAQYLFFLSRIKEDYTNQNDPMVASYQASLNIDIKRKAIYNTYMKFIDVEMLKTTAKVHRLAGERSQSIQKTKKASKLYQSLQESAALTYFLSLEVDSSLTQLASHQVIAQSADEIGDDTEDQDLDLEGKTEESKEGIQATATLDEANPTTTPNFSAPAQEDEDEFEDDPPATTSSEDGDDED